MKKRLIASVLLSLSLPLSAADEAGSKRVDLAHDVRDPAYGQILYHYYQKQYFAAMTDIVVALERNELPTQGDRARVLLGALYASYGMPAEAETLFNQLLSESVAPELASRVWLHLAEIYYRNQRYDDAMALLDTHLSTVPEDVSDSYRALRTRLLMKLQRYEETAPLLAELDRNPSLSGYLRYNLAVSRINAGQGSEGERLLWQLVNLPPDDDEINALKDKSMLALGVHYLRTGNHAQARALMEAARLEGPYSEMALLLHARAWLASDEPGRALPSLTALSRRSMQFEEAQEAALALPFLYEKLGDWRRAQQAYRDAIAAYSEHFNYLAGLEATIRSGDWFAALAPEPRYSTAMEAVPRFEPARVESFATFRTLFATHVFQKSWRAWHEQVRQQNLLQDWQRKLPALNELLAAHVRKYRDGLPAARQMLADVHEAGMDERLNELEQRLTRAAAQGDWYALADAGKQPLIDAMADVRQRADKLGDRLKPELRDKAALYAGVLKWELAQQEVPREWHHRRALDQLAGLMADNRKAIAALERAASGASASVYQLGEELASLNNELYALASTGERLKGRLQQRIEGLALAEVSRTRERLQYFIAESWAAMADLEHRALRAGYSASRRSDE